MRIKVMMGCLGLASLLIAHGAAAVPVGVLNGSGQYTGINGLDVSGTLYNVTFKDGTFASALGGAFDFTTDTSAAFAATAIYSALASPLTALNADPNLTFGCQNAAPLLACKILTPWSINQFGDVEVIEMRNGRESQNVQNGNSGYGISTALNTTNFVDQSGSDYVWADWSLASVVVTPVPEPTTLALLAAGLLAGGAGFRRRRS